MTSAADEVIAALGKAGPVGTVEITTHGRKSGQPRRVEIAYHVIDGRLFISGVPYPRRRGWLANLDADPSLTLHLRKPVPRDVAATARIIDTAPERRAVLEFLPRHRRPRELKAGLRPSPPTRASVDAPG